jgi:hypothetical protein
MIRFWMLAVVCSLLVARALFAADHQPIPAPSKAQHGEQLQGSTLTNNDPAFTLTLTSRYVRVKSVGDALYTFRTTDSSNGAIVAIHRLGRTVERDSVDVSNFKERDARRIPAVWKSLQLDAFAWHTTSKGGNTSAARWTQIPLEGQAISVLMLIPEDKEQYADAILQDFLDGIDGPTNWRIPTQLTPAQRAVHVAIGLALLVVVLAAPACLLVVLRRARQAGNPAAAAKLKSHLAALSPPQPEKASYWMRVFALTFTLIAVVLGYLSLLTLGVALISDQSFGEAFHEVTLFVNVVLLIPLSGTAFLLSRTLRRRGCIVADLGPDRLRMLFCVAAILCLIAATLQGFSALQNLNRRPSNVGQWYAVSLAAMMLSMVPQFAIRAFGRIQLTENGIFQNCSLLRWEQVDFYRWEDTSTNLLVKAKGPLSLNLPVPTMDKQPIQELLARHGIAQRLE